MAQFDFQVVQRAVGEAPLGKSGHWTSVFRFGGVEVSLRRWRGDPVEVGSEDTVVFVRGFLNYAGAVGDKAVVRLRRDLDSGLRVEDVMASTRGAFTLLAMDRRDNSATIAQSTNAVLPIYVGTVGGASAWSTSLLGLAASLQAPLDPVGVEQFVHLGSTLGETTMFDGIRRVHGAAVIRFDGARSSSSCSYDPRSVMDHIVFHSDVDRVERSIRESLAPLAGREPGQVLLALTSGIDSRTVLAVLMSAGCSDPDTFTSGSTSSPDVRRAHEVSRTLGLHHETVPPAQALADLAALDEAVEVADGAVDPSRFSLILRLKQRSGRYQAVLGGAGGPLYKDHFWLYEFNRVDTQRAPNWARIAKFAVLGHQIRGELTPNGRNLEGFLTQEFVSHSAELESATTGTKHDYVYATYKIPIFSGPSIAAACRLCETYEPLLDSQNVACSTTISHRLRKRNYLQFSVISKLLPSTRWIVTDDWLPFIPATGLRSPLRLLRAIRYAQAAKRKANVLFRGRNGQADPDTMDSADDEVVDVFLRALLQCSETLRAIGPDFKNASDQLPAAERRRYQVAAGAVALFVSKVRSGNWRLAHDSDTERLLSNWVGDSAKS